MLTNVLLRSEFNGVKCCRTIEFSTSSKANALALIKAIDRYALDDVDCIRFFDHEKPSWYKDEDEDED